MKVITHFYDEHRKPTPLSNFYHAPREFKEGVFPTLEHYFQAMKTMNLAERQRIRQAATPGAAKRYGRECDLRTDWEPIKLIVMRYGLHVKFAAGTKEADYLLATGNWELQEGNTWGDHFWGVMDGKGQNWLGWLLMAQRAHLRATVGDVVAG